MVLSPFGTDRRGGGKRHRMGAAHPLTLRALCPWRRGWPNVFASTLLRGMTAGGTGGELSALVGMRGKCQELTSIKLGWWCSTQERAASISNTSQD